MRKPIGERIMPLPYLKLFFNKKPTVTWERYYTLPNEEYVKKQQQQLECIEQERKKAEAQKLAKEEAERQKAEKERKEREEREWIEHEKQEEIERELKRQEELKRQKESEQQQLAENEAKKLFSASLLDNLIDISSHEETSEDEEKGPDSPKNNPSTPVPLIKDIKKEKEDGDTNPDKTDPEHSNANGQPVGNNTPKSQSSTPKVKKEPQDEMEVTSGNPAVPENTNSDIQTKNVLMDPRSDEIESMLTELGKLIVDANLLYALQNLKELGKTMRQNLVLAESRDVNASQVNKPPQCGCNLFTDMNIGGASWPIDILTPLSGEAYIKQEDCSSAPFNSPPQMGRIFGNRKRLSSTDFSDLYSSASKQK